MTVGSFVRPWALLAAGLLLALAARAEPLTIAVSRSPLSLPLYMAEAAGLFAAEGLQVRRIDCVGGRRCMRLLLDGQADVATVGDTPIMLGGFETPDFVVIATMASTHEDLKLMARPDAGVRRARDLSGKRIGVVIGTASQYFLDSFLLVHGVDPRQVRSVSLQPEAMLEALQARQVDAVSVFEPYGYRIAGTLKADVVTLPDAGAYNATFNLAAHRRLTGPRDPDLVKLLAAVDRAVSLIHADPERAKAVLRERLATDAAFVQWMWPTMQFRLSLDQSLLKTLESEARWALREGHVRGRMAPNYLPFLHRGPLLQVRPAAVGISR